MGRKLHIGGRIKEDGWELLDIQSGPGVDYVRDASDLSIFEDRTFDTLYASHVLEHFVAGDMHRTLKEWHRVLDSEGQLYLSVPDMDVLTALYSDPDTSDQEKIKITQFIHGGHTDPYDVHHFNFNKRILAQAIKDAGFAKARFVKSMGMYQDSSEIEFRGKRISLNVISTKGKLEPRAAAKLDVSGIAKDVFYFISLPRVDFTANAFCIANTMLNLQIHGQRDEGVFWEQGMEQMLETAIEKGYKYGMSIDYDTWFTEYHVKDLYDVMEENPDIDALIAVQPRRENDYPISGTFEDEEGHTVLVSRGPFDANHTKDVDTGNFGLTMLRLSSLDKIPKPWFEHKTNKDGKWGKGKKHADVNFWIKCKKTGLNIKLAETYVGHLELKCQFSGPPETGFKTVSMDMNKIHAGQIPEWAIPRSYRKGKKLVTDVNLKG